METCNRSIDAPFRMAVQRVVRPDQDFRGYTGQIASGIVRPGDEVIALPSGRRTHIRRIVTFDGDLEVAHAPLSVTLTLEDEIDIGRGDMIAGGERSAKRRGPSKPPWYGSMEDRSMTARALSGETHRAYSPGARRGSAPSRQRGHARNRAGCQVGDERSRRGARGHFASTFSSTPTPTIAAPAASS